ncbi:4'-phosphopantetheinyl transferase superfamily protein [Lichenicoccus roseus]|uniref:4'-phosphopantetheinyl transferase superfamily protein n=2 Tax=Lichenicoccus roseus TaxID=2683649 RepID=A0A5R9IZZ8_9PROT|nr:4'-phosphopantetheinyl transferase superfamily protein [Lichenicoccus roseus]
MAASGEILRLCHWDLDMPEDRLEFLHETLSADERARIERLATPRLQARAIAARGGMRQALGRHLGAAPASLRFVTTSFGKPLLAGGGIQFNLSHSGGLALLGISEHGRIGVDVEQAAQVPLELLAMLAPAEAAAIALLDGLDQAAAFFDCWTRKEAFAKATGLGMSLPFDSFDVVSRSGHVTLLGPVAAAVAAAPRVWRTASLGRIARCYGAVSVETTLDCVPFALEPLH